MGVTVHLVVSLLLIGSGLTAVIADAPRWWSACLGRFDTEECVTRQDHAYDIGGYAVDGTIDAARRPHGHQRPTVGAGALAIASPMASYLTMSIFYLSHDTVPWTTTVAGLLTVLAGITFLGAHDKTRDGQSPPRSAATGSSEAALSAG